MKIRHENFLTPPLPNRCVIIEQPQYNKTYGYLTL